MEFSAFVPEATTVEKETEPSILISEVVGPQAEAFGQEDNVVPMVEPKITIPEESMGSRDGDQLPEESVALEVKVDVPYAGPGMYCSKVMPRLLPHRNLGRI